MEVNKEEIQRMCASCTLAQGDGSCGDTRISASTQQMAAETGVCYRAYRMHPNGQELTHSGRTRSRGKWLWSKTFNGRRR